MRRAGLRGVTREHAQGRGNPAAASATWKPRTATSILGVRSSGIVSPIESALPTTWQTAHALPSEALSNLLLTNSSRVPLVSGSTSKEPRQVVRLAELGRLDGWPDSGPQGGMRCSCQTDLLELFLTQGPASVLQRRRLGEAHGANRPHDPQHRMAEGFKQNHGVPGRARPLRGLEAGAGSRPGRGHIRRHVRRDKLWPTACSPRALNHQRWPLSLAGRRLPESAPYPDRIPSSGNSSISSSARPWPDEPFVSFVDDLAQLRVTPPSGWTAVDLADSRQAWRRARIRSCTSTRPSWLGSLRPRAEEVRWGVLHPGARGSPTSCARWTTCCDARIG